LPSLALLLLDISLGTFSRPVSFGIDRLSIEVKAI
jgi:hypothetical protein